MSIRRIPTQDELQDWLAGQTGMFPLGEMASANVTAELERFEGDLAVLLKNQSIARTLKSTTIMLPALAQDGSIRPRPELVVPNKNIERLALPGVFLLESRSRAARSRQFVTNATPTSVEMLVTAFEEDSANFRALQPRLKQFSEVDRTWRCGSGPNGCHGNPAPG
jgi:hypothetical protein